MSRRKAVPKTAGGAVKEKRKGYSVVKEAEVLGGEAEDACGEVSEGKDVEAVIMEEGAEGGFVLGSRPGAPELDGVGAVGAWGRRAGKADEGFDGLETAAEAPMGGFVHEVDLRGKAGESEFGGDDRGVEAFGVEADPDGIVCPFGEEAVEGTAADERAEVPGVPDGDAGDMGGAGEAVGFDVEESGGLREGAEDAYAVSGRKVGDEPREKTAAKGGIERGEGGPDAGGTGGGEVARGLVGELVAGQNTGMPKADFGLGGNARHQAERLFEEVHGVQGMTGELSAESSGFSRMSWSPHLRVRRRSVGP